VYSPQKSSYYPEILSLYAQGEDIEVRGTGVTMLTYDAQGTPTEHATITHAINGSNLYTVKIGNNGGFVEVYSESNFKLKINFAF